MLINKNKTPNKIKNMRVSLLIGLFVVVDSDLSDLITDSVLLDNESVFITLLFSSSSFSSF
jgi:hypothetical protein